MVDREPTHKVLLALRQEMIVGPIDGPLNGVPLQLTDRLVNRLNKAQAEVTAAEADIRKWCERTLQWVPPVEDLR